MMMKFFAAGVVVAILVWLLVPPHPYQGPVSDHFDGNRFFNPGKPLNKGLFTVLKWRFTSKREPWPLYSDLPVVDRPPSRVEGNLLRVSYVGQVTTLIQTQGLNILTDPIWSDRASPFSSIGPKRVHPPGIRFADLPPIDLVLISHNHYDHLDLTTIKRLWQRDRPRILTPQGNDTIIHSKVPEARVETHDWGDQVVVGPQLTVHFEPMHHWSARSPFDRNRALWAAFVLTTPGGRIYFVGDSGYGGGDTFREARAKYGSFRLAILPIGSYDPRWFMAYGHMNPEEAVRAWNELGRPFMLPTHYRTFQLADTAYGQPLIDLGVAMEAAKAPEGRIRPLMAGEHWWVDAESGSGANTQVRGEWRH
jgi:L-ascorbate metabolism protein UlaG (beta-lactamase superfamily)